MTFPAPGPDDTRVVVADCHGNFPALRALLESAGVLDEHGQRRPGFWVCQLGDLMHGGDNVTDADLTTLELSQDWVDCQLVGNHDLPFLGRLRASFVGMHSFDGRPRHPAAQDLINATVRRGRWWAAAAVDGWLVTHAGLAPHIFDRQLDDIVAAAATGQFDNREVAQAFAKALNARFDDRMTSTDPDAFDPVVEAIGTARGGRAPVGGIFWCDWKELCVSCARLGTPVRQIVGHTAQPLINRKEGNRPRRKRVGGKTTLWNIDLAGVVDGHIACLVKDPADDDWTPVVIERPARPGPPPGESAAACLTRAVAKARRSADAA